MKMGKSSQASLGEDDHLSMIRERKWQLEEQMYTMQQKRKQLMSQLETLIPSLTVRYIIDIECYGSTVIILLVHLSPEEKLWSYVREQS